MRLGKRSIIARADSAAVRDRINMLKGREAWRPLAPSLTPREFERSFPEGAPSPYMLIAAGVAPQAARRLRGVVHVDDTSRPQVVTAPGPYRDLLHEIGAATGTEAVICTSFNRAGEPLVYTPVTRCRPRARWASISSPETVGRFRWLIQPLRVGRVLWEERQANGDGGT